jgi:hypothetical protein
MIKPKEFTVGGETVQVSCKFAKVFPPKPIYALEENGDPLSQRSAGLISETEYQQCQTWERVCGVMEIGEKCLSCPHSLKYDGSDIVGTQKFSSVVPEPPSIAPPFYRPMK